MLKTCSGVLWVSTENLVTLALVVLVLYDDRQKTFGTL